MKKPHVLPFERPAADLQERIKTLEPMVAGHPELAEPLERLHEAHRELEERLIEELTRQLFDQALFKLTMRFMEALKRLGELWVSCNHRLQGFDPLLQISGGPLKW